MPVARESKRAAKSYTLLPKLLSGEVYVEPETRTAASAAEVT